MANVLDKNPIVFDTAGATSAVARELHISSIIVLASADTWEVVLHDADSGDLVFEAQSDIANHRSIYWSPSDALTVSGLYASTLTDIDKVIVYLRAEKAI